MKNLLAMVRKDNSVLYQIFSILVVFIVLIIVFSVWAYPFFFTVENIFSIALQTATIAVIGLGLTLVLITGGIDLSVGSVIAFSGVLSALAMKNNIPVSISVLIGIGTGALVGMTNGIMVAYVKISPFVATLGTLSIVRGLALLITEGRPVSGLPAEFRVYGNGTFINLPIPFLLLIGVAIILHLILTKTRLGLHIYATGSNKEAAKLSGINTEKILLWVYTASGLLAGLAGVIFSSRLITGQPSAGGGYELLAIASAVIGGTSLSGGEGTVWGTILGAFIIGVLRNGLNLIGISSFVQEVLIGVIIILAVVLEGIKELKNKS